MIRRNFLLALLPCFVMGSLLGCGGGGDSRPAKLSLSGHNAEGLRISLSQQSAIISNGSGNAYTLTVKNETTKTQSYLFDRDSQGTSPASFSLENEAGEEVFGFPDLETATLESAELKPNESLTRTLSVPASRLAQNGTYRATAYFSNGSVLGDGAADKLGPLEVRVR